MKYWKLYKTLISFTMYFLYIKKIKIKFIYLSNSNSYRFNQLYLVLQPWIKLLYLSDAMVANKVNYITWQELEYVEIQLLYKAIIMFSY